MFNLKCGIIGLGKLGLPLAKLLYSKGIFDFAVDKSEKARHDFSQYINNNFVNIYPDIISIAKLSDIIFLTVNDSLIENTANTLTNLFNSKLENKLIVHCSGVLDDSILKECKRFNALTATAHPYQTFFYPDTNIFKNIGWGISSSCNVDLISELITFIDGKPIDISKLNNGNKSLYHASAAVASNFLSSIITLSKGIAINFGINPEDFLTRIINTTVDNNIKSINSTEEFPLTGPIARGDIETIKSHLNALNNNECYKNSYIYFALGTNELALKYNIINNIVYNNIKNILLNELK